MWRLTVLPYTTYSPYTTYAYMVYTTLEVFTLRLLKTLGSQDLRISRSGDMSRQTIYSISRSDISDLDISSRHLEISDLKTSLGLVFFQHYYCIPPACIHACLHAYILLAVVVVISLSCVMSGLSRSQDQTSSRSPDLEIYLNI